MAKPVRIATVPPVMAAILIVVLRLCTNAFQSPGLWVGLFCLSLLPLGAYGIWYLIPPLRQRGRKAQRSVAVVCSCLGYILNAAFCLAARRGAVETVAVLTYLFSGLVTALLSFAFHIKSSGHAAGMSGPVAMLAIRVHPLFLLGYLLLVPVVRSSLALKRHTAPELLLGASVPVIVQGILMLLLG